MVNYTRDEIVKRLKDVVNLIQQEHSDEAERTLAKSQRFPLDLYVERLENLIEDPNASRRSSGDSNVSARGTVDSYGSSDAEGDSIERQHQLERLGNIHKILRAAYKYADARKEDDDRIEAEYRQAKEAWNEQGRRKFDIAKEASKQQGNDEFKKLLNTLSNDFIGEVLSSTRPRSEKDTGNVKENLDVQSKIESLTYNFRRGLRAEKPFLECFKPNDESSTFFNTMEISKKEGERGGVSNRAAARADRLFAVIQDRKENGYGKHAQLLFDDIASGRYSVPATTRKSSVTTKNSEKLLGINDEKLTPVRKQIANKKSQLADCREGAGEMRRQNSKLEGKDEEVETTNNKEVDPRDEYIFSLSEKEVSKRIARRLNTLGPYIWGKQCLQPHVTLPGSKPTIEDEIRAMKLLKIIRQDVARERIWGPQPADTHEEEYQNSLDLLECIATKLGV